MKEEIPLHPREPDHDVQQRRMTDRGSDPGTAEPGVPPRTRDPGQDPSEEADDPDGATRHGPGTTQADEARQDGS